MRFAKPPDIYLDIVITFQLSLRADTLVKDHVLQLKWIDIFWKWNIMVI